MDHALDHDNKEAVQKLWFLVHNAFVNKEAV